MIPNRSAEKEYVLSLASTGGTYTLCISQSVTLDSILLIVSLSAMKFDAIFTLFQFGINIY